MDFSSLLSDPLFLSIVSSVVIGAAIVAYFVGSPKKEKVLILERLKPGTSILRADVGYQRQKNPGEMMLKLKDGRKFVVPEEKTSTFETVTFQGKQRKLWGLENGQITSLADKLAEVSSILLDHATVTAAMTRASAKRLAAPKLPKSDLYLYLAMGAIVGMALAWILYPQLNHPAPVIQCYRLLPNGSRVFQGYC